MAIASALQGVRTRIEAAARDAGRDPAGIQLIAVSKTFPAEAVAEAAACDQVHFGESYAQELRDKAAALPGALRWHFIGRLQTNKARYIAPVAHRVHALETVRQAEALVRRAPGPLRCLVPVNAAGEASKGGLPPREVLDRCEVLSKIEGIEIVGLMTLPPWSEDPQDAAPWFAQVADLAARGRARGIPLHELSMGMSHDFEVAIHHGATWVRVGTAVFGERR